MQMIQVCQDEVDETKPQMPDIYMLQTYMCWTVKEIKRVIKDTARELAKKNGEEVDAFVLKMYEELQIMLDFKLWLRKPSRSLAAQTVDSYV
jgi:hypothetical protein